MATLARLPQMRQAEAARGLKERYDLEIVQPFQERVDRRVLQVTFHQTHGAGRSFGAALFAQPAKRS